MVGVIYASLLNNSTQLVMVTEKDTAVIVDLATLEPLGSPLELGGKPSVVKAFNEFPNSLFFGLEKKSLVGATHVLKILFTNHEIVVDAHTDRITAIEYTNYNGKHVFFTGSLDASVKAWTPSADGATLDLIATSPMAAKILSLQMGGPSFLICGLESGALQGWNLENNSFDQIPAH